MVFLLRRKICKILDSYEIHYKIKINKFQRKNEVYILEICKEHISKFINSIGFSHPRKMLEVKRYLLTSSASRNFTGYIKEYKPKIPEEKFIELCNYLRPIKNSSKARFTSEFKKLKYSKKREILNSLRINFDIDKEPNLKGFINSHKIQTILSNYCVYKKITNKVSDIEIKKLLNRLHLIWI
jgi:hypothetical protein